MPVLVSLSVLESSSLGLIGHTFCPISPDQSILLILAELRVWQNRHWMAAREAVSAELPPPVFIVTADSRDASKSQPRVLSRQDAERELRTAKSLKTRPSRNRILTRFPCGVKTSINHPPQRLSTKKAAPRGAAFARSFLLIVTQKLFQHIHRRAANRIFLSGIEKIAYLDFRPNAHGAIAYIARMF